MTHTQIISLEIDTTLQQQVEAVFQKLGLSSQEAIRLFYEQVQLKQTWPFEMIPQPNATTQQALREAQTRTGLSRVADVNELFYDQPLKAILWRDPSTVHKLPRPIGLAKDRFQVSPRFFEELPEELLEAFEGK